MTRHHKAIGLSVAALLATTTLAPAQNLLGLDAFNPSLVEIDTSIPMIINSQPLTLAGQSIDRGNGLARNPETGVLYAILNLSGQSGRELVTVDDVTGVCTSVGDTGDKFSSITFTRDGTLYGVTGDGASVPETLYTLSLVNGSATLVLALGNGNDGEVIGYSFSEEHILHFSGNGVNNDIINGKILEPIQPLVPIVDPLIMLSGDPTNEILGMVDNGKRGMFITDRFSPMLYEVSQSGVVTTIGPLSDDIRGLAYVRPSNDDCAQATPIGNGTFAGNLLGATNDGDATCGFGEDTSPDIWYSYTAAGTGMLTVTTCGTHDMFGTDTGVDTVLSVHSGCPGDTMNSLACNDDTGSCMEMGLNRDSMVQVPVNLGDTVLIRVANFDAGTSGTADVRTGPIVLNTSLAISDPFPSSCNGDGGNQMGCTDCPCMNNAPTGTIGGCLNSASTSLMLTASGDASVSLPPAITTDLRFGATGAPANAFCILNSGDALAPGNPANPCFGLDTGGLAAVFDGLRCAIMNTRRHGGRSADASGDIGVTNNPWGGEGGPPVGIAVAGGGFVLGQTRHFQIINRDDAMASCGTGLNTSQSRRVTFTP